MTQASRRFGFFALLAGLSLMITARPAQAYFTTLDTGEVIAPGKYQISAAPQLIFNRYDGVNVIGQFDTGINDSSSARAILGFGKVDFQVGGFYKYVPIPDTKSQPAIGGEAGVIVARVNGNTETSLRLHPLISKKLETEIGDLIPYGSLPFGITTRPDKTVVPVQLVVGSELRPLNTPNWSFFAEVGVNVNEAFGYIAGAVAWRFDEAMLERH